MKIFLPLFIALLFLSYESVRAEDIAVAADPSEATNNENLAPGAVIIEGDRMQVYLDRKFKSIGNAKLHREQQDIYGDSIEYDLENHELHVLGNTRIESGNSTITGPELRLKLDDSSGVMKNASFTIKKQLADLPPIGAVQATNISGRITTDSSAFVNSASERFSDQNVTDVNTGAPKLKSRATDSRGDAETILFEPPDRKVLKSARYTTCEVGSDAWYLKAGEMEINDYTKLGTARNARIEFQGVPILYTPYITFSLTNQRKSGFLGPTFGTTTRSGFELEVPYYWNISPNKDATLATRVLSKRGLQLEGEFRYLSEQYSGIDALEILPDDSQKKATRYYANLKHQQTFGNGWSANYDFERVSDDQYFADLSTRITSTSRVNLPQQGSVNYSGSIFSFNGLVQKYQTLDGLSFPYERLPQLTLTANKELGPTINNFYSQFVRFDRDPKALLVLAPRATGLQTDVTGDRFSAYPSISVPLARPYGYITPKLGVNYTRYQLNNPDFTLNGVNGKYQSDSRTLPIFSVDSGLYFDRNTRVVKNTYIQTLEPRLYYVYIPFKDQSRLPIFDTAESDLNLGTLFLENQFVGGDRINDANQLSLAVTTRMIDAKTGVQRLAATLGDRIYFADQRVTLPGVARRTGANSDIVSAVTARLLNDWNVDAALQFNTETSHAAKANIGTRYNPEPGKTLNLSYRYTQESLEQIDVSAQWPITRNWYGVGRYNYSLRDDQTIEAIAGVEYDAGCWQARGVFQRVSTATATSNTALFFQLELGGLASIGSNPLNLLKRSVSGYVSSGLIPEFSNNQLSQ